MSILTWLDGGEKRPVLYVSCKNGKLDSVLYHKAGVRWTAQAAPHEDRLEIAHGEEATGEQHKVTTMKEARETAARLIAEPPITRTKSTGWICPVCGTVMGPNVKTCQLCSVRTIMIPGVPEVR
jgi:rubrerythrin